MHIRTLLLPVAGLGQRLQPLTLTTPKNLIRLNGKPLIEYALAEARAAGIEEAVVIVGPQHRSHYLAYLAQAERRFPDIKFHFRLQRDPWGDGHAILQARDLVAGEPFAVRFCDDVIVDERPTLPRLIEHSRVRQSSAILLERISPDDVSRYGVVAAQKVGGQIHRITGVVEKPAVAEAPSNLIIVGGYVLESRIMDRLAFMSAGMKREKDALRISHALTFEIAAGASVHGWEFSGMRLDCGTLKGLRKAEEHVQAMSEGIRQVSRR